MRKETLETIEQELYLNLFGQVGAFRALLRRYLSPVNFTAEVAVYIYSWFGVDLDKISKEYEKECEEL